MVFHDKPGTAEYPHAQPDSRFLAQLALRIRVPKHVLIKQRTTMLLSVVLQFVRVLVAYSGFNSQCTQTIHLPRLTSNCATELRSIPSSQQPGSSVTASPMNFLFPARSTGKSSRGGTGASSRLDFVLQAATPVIAAAVVATVLKPKASHALVSDEEEDPVALPSAPSCILPF